MGKWDMITCNYNSADETINFGSRFIGDSQNLYESVTLATIYNSESDSKSPVVNGKIHGGKIMLTADRALKVFKNFECSSLSSDLLLDDVVEKFCITPDDKYFLVCLRNGCISCWTFTNVCVFASLIEENAYNMSSCFAGCFIENVTGNLSFIIVTTTGKILRVSQDNPNKEDSFALTELKDLNCYVHLASYCSPYLLLDGSLTYSYNVAADEIISDESCVLLKLCSYNHMFVGLLESMELVRVCAETLLVFDIGINDKHKYTDFLFIPDFSAESRILAITEPDDAGASFIKNITYPGLQQIFSLKIYDELYLITPENILNDIYVIKVKQDELSVMLLAETAPERRLEKLLQKQCFAEAEKFAETYNLDLNIVRKARAQVIVDQTVCTEEDVENLLTILEEIQDTLFTLQSCIDVHFSCQRLEDVKAILVYGCSNLPPKSIKNEEVRVLYPSLSSTLLRFNTYCMLLKCKRNNFDPDKWFQFSQCNLVEAVIHALENYNIEESVIIYNLLCSTASATLYNEDIERILDGLKHMTPQTYEPFLYTFIPTTLKYLPHTLTVFTEWLSRKVFYLEKKGGFPERAIALTEVFLKLFIIENSQVNQVSRINGLLVGLKNLEVLKNCFDVVIPLRDCLEGPRKFVNSICSLNMDEILFDNLLQNFLDKYMFEHHLEHDEILLEKIRSVTKYVEKYWAQVVPYVLRTINSVQIKLEAILVLIDAADVPWCPMMEDICKSALQYSHPLVDVIRQQILRVPAIIVLKKYHIKQKPKYFELLVNHIIKMNEPTMLEDIYCLCANDDERHQANLVLATQRITVGKISEALKIIDSNEEKEMLKCCEHLITFLQIGLENKFGYPSLSENCYSILNPIFTRLMNAKCGLYLEDRLEMMQKFYKIRKHLNRKVTFEQLFSPSRKKSLMEELLYDVIDQFNNEEIDIVGALQKCDQLAHCLSKDVDEILIDFCTKIGDFGVILDAAKIIYDRSNDSKHLSLTAILLLKYVGSTTVCISDMTMCNFNDTFLPTSDGKCLINFEEGLDLADKLAAKAVLKSKGDDILAVMEVIRWIQTGFYLVANKEYNVDGYMFKDRYYSNLMSPTRSTFDALKRIFNLYVGFVAKSPFPNTKYLTHFTSDIPMLSREQFQQEIRYLPQTIQNLATQGQHFTAYQLIVTLTYGLIYGQNVNEETRNILGTIGKECIKQLFQQVITSRNVDTELAYLLLLSGNINSSQGYLRKALMAYRRDVEKFRIIAELGLRLVNDFNKDSGRDKLKSLIFSCKWWKRLKSCGMSFDEFNQLSREVALEKLIEFNMDITLLQEYSLDFKLDLQKLYVTILERRLLNWKPMYTVDVDINGQRLLSLCNVGAALFEECERIIKNIENKMVVISVLQKLLKKINFYHYEVVSCIIQFLSTLSGDDKKYCQWMKLLKCLEEYTRVSKPSQTEIEEWYTAFPYTQNVDPLSEWRLPFTPTLFTNNITHIIRPEFTLDTYRWWFDVTEILNNNLDRDDICILVVKEVVAKGILASKETGWQLYPKHTHLFEMLDECVHNIRDLEKATSVMYHLMTCVPEGSDQVHAASLCYKYAQRYVEENLEDPDVLKAFTKIQNKYLSFSTIQILHKNNLAEKRYLSIVSSPNNLIDALYIDERIVMRTGKLLVDFPDINKAVDEIGALHNIDLMEKRSDLLYNWLNFKYDGTVDDNGSNLKRASYLCMGNINVWDKFLLKVGLDDGSKTKSNYFHRAQALKCFCSIMSDAKIVQMTAFTKEELINFVDKLLLASNLQRLGYNFDIQTLDGTPKNKLVQQLSKNVDSNLRVIASICITYKIYDTRYWEVILSTAIKNNMLNELEDYVNFLKDIVFCLHQPFYVAAWQKITNCMLSQFDSVVESRKTELCVEYIQKVQACPVLPSLNFAYAIRTLLHEQKPEFAAMLLQYVEGDAREKIAKEIIRSKEGILEDIVKLEKFGIWGISSVVYFLNDLHH